MQGLQWGDDKVRAVRSLLLKLRLIEEVRRTDDRTGKVIGWYIRLPYFHPTDLPECGCYQSVDSETTNASRSVRGNASRSVKGAVLHVRSERTVFVPTVAYPKTKKAMYDTLKRRGIEPNPDYDGNFFKQMQASGWKIRGKPVRDWPTAYQARLEVTQP